jgi:hypothetical protein
VNKLGTPWEFVEKTMKTSWDIVITSWEHIKSNKKINTLILPQKKNYLNPMGACYLTSLGARFF